MTIGQSIRAQRRSIGASQSWLAAQISVSRGTVCNWERGITSPTTACLVRIAAAVGCTVQELISGVEPTNVHTSADFCRGGVGS